MKKRTEAHIDEIVAMCDGDLRGALKASMLINEHLESQLEQLHAAHARYENTERRMSSLH
jgi:VIT1/CCC1 family predicted Fe2+/Mn2+ transporter